MNILVLVNGAPFHRPFFSRVGKALERMGHNVRYAVDSHYTDYLYPGDPLPSQRTSYFSEYFEAHYDDERRGVPDALRGTNLWPTVFSDLDRAFSAPGAYRSAEYYERLLELLIGFFWKLCDDHAIDCVVYEAVSNSFAHVAYRVIRARGGEFIGFMASRIPGRTDILDSEYMVNSQTGAHYQALLSGARAMDPALRAFVDDYLANFRKKKADYMVQLDFLLGSPLRTYSDKGRMMTFARSLRYLAMERRHHRYSFQVANPAVVFPHQFLRECARYAKVRYLRRKTYTQPDLGANYFVYPMQFHPESSSSVNAVHFVDELANVRNIALNMPFGTRLFVKDHPHAAARDRLALYRAIARFPNVELIDPSFDGQTLVRHAKAVVTCTSTMGYEAIIFGVPVFTFGETLWDFYPGSVRLHSFAGAFEAFSKAGSIRASRRELEAFIAAYFLSTVEGIFDLKRSHDDERYVSRVAECLVSEAGRRRQSPTADLTSAPAMSQ